jgi:type IV pilus assembly protein PilA
VSEGLSLAGGAKTAIAEYYASKGAFASNNGSYGLPLASSITGNAVTSVNAANGKITITYNAKVDNGKQLVLSPVVSAGGINWKCGATGTDVPSKYLPSSCR